MVHQPTRNDHSSCATCGASLTDSHTGGPCPACLMNLGRAAWHQTMAGGSFQMAQTIAPGHGASPGNGLPAGLAEMFPELEILHLIGQGGMGAVYCARQRSLGRLVALKVINPESRSEQTFAERFSREARALGQLNHPNIVTVYDFGQRGKTYFFLMEFVDGINLRQMLQTGKLAPHQALAIVPAICDALQYAHDKGIVHRDIKPENILVDTQGDVRIADFGLAKLLDQKTAGPTLTQANQVMGTMHYMAPEQWERPLDVDHRADIYSLGVVFYELLTGELPLGRFATPSEKVQVDIRLDEIVLQTLAKEPSLRYQKVSDIKTDMQSLPVQIARPQPPVKPDAKFDESKLTGPFPTSGFFGSFSDGQTYRNLAYLFLSFPLGLIYFVVMLVGLSLGVGTILLWIGGFTLIGTFMAAHGFMRIEQRLALGLLRCRLPRTAKRPVLTQPTLMQRVKHLFFDPQSWIGIIYLIGKFPLGVISLVTAIIAIVVPLVFLGMPIMTAIGFNDSNVGDWEIDTMPEAGIFAVAGIPVAFVLIYLVNSVAWLHAGWAKICLARK